jgi:hypothetical protein
MPDREVTTFRVTLHSHSGYPAQGLGEISAITFELPCIQN